MKQNKHAQLRQKYLAKIAAAQAEMKAWQLKLSVLDDIENELEEAAEIGDETLFSKVVPPADASNGKKYEGFTVTAAMLDAVSSIGQTTGVTPSEIAKYLIQHGISSTSRSLTNTIGTALGRQIARGKIKSAVVGGKKKYFPA